MNAPDATIDRLQRLLAKTTDAALAVSSVEGERLFEQLAQRLAQVLDVDAAMIAVYTDAARRRARTRATVLDGRALAPFEYDIEHSPCRGLAGRDSRFAASGVNAEFAPGTLFRAKGFDSYAGRALVDSAGRTLGLVVALHRAPMADPPVTEAVLQVFALRAAAELERERAERALRDSEASYRAIFDASEDAIFVHDWDSGAILDVSPKAIELYGHQRAALQRLRVGDLSANVPPYTEADALRHIQQARASAAPLRFEWRARHRDGHLMWHEVTLKRADIAGRPHVLAFVRDITDRKEAIEALQVREEQYRAIFEGTADGLVLWDENFNIVDVNPQFLQAYGFSREELLGRTYPSQLPADYVRERREFIRRGLAGERVEARSLAIRKDGSTFDIEVRLLPIRLRGHPHALAIVRDVSERARAEQALQASEAQYRAIFNASADAMVLWDADLRRVDINPAYERLFGLTRAQVLAGIGFEHQTPEYIEQRRALVRRTLAGERCQVELESVRRDGGRLLVEVRTIPIEHRGAPHVLAIVRDVTERRKAEDALRASEAQYRAIFNASADALVLRDAAFRIVDVNATYEAMSGLARDEVLGVDRVLANPPDVAERIRQLHERALAGAPIALETPFFRRDGARFEIELRGMPIRHRGAPHVLYIGRDITARREAERQRRDLELQLLQAQKMEAIGQLTGGIAHDFNNILASILGYLGLAAERPAAETDGRLADHLQQAQQGCRRARDLIQQMLAFGRGQQGERRLLALGPLLEESLRLLRATLPASVALTSAIEDDTAAASVDPVQLQQVLLNLGINARDAIGGAGRIAVELRRREVVQLACASCGRALSGTYLELAVRDSGPGVDAALRARIFEPFFSTKAPGRGTGMGLATVQRIVHDHGGHLLIEADPALGGARFAVLLPPAAAVQEAPAATAITAAPARPAPLAGRVLLVDDEASVLSFMRELLGNWGLEVVATREPRAALARLQQAPAAFDLVLTDQTMPQMSGLDLAHAAATLTPRVPVLLYSGYADVIDADALQRAGVCRLLRKPVEPAELRAALESCLQPRGDGAQP
jgi:PAS domain S-box-containing protein